MISNFVNFEEFCMKKGAGQGFLLKPFCPTLKNSSPMRTLAGAFCVYSLGIGPE